MGLQLPLLLQVLFGLYFVSVAVFIVSENKTPQLSFAWMLLFITVPVIGLGIYFLFGRDYKAFSRRRRLTSQDAPEDLTTLLTTLEGEHDQALRSLGQAQTRHDKLARLVNSNSNSLVTTRNEVTILQNADQLYPAMVASIEAATSSVHLHYYSWNADQVGEALLAILSRKAREGIEVRLLYDPLGSLMGLSWNYIRRMRKAGVQMRPFSSLWRLHTISYRNHRKITVIDGEVAFTGGLNIGDEHLNPPAGFDAWRDTHIMVRGSVVRALQGVFAIDWLNATNEELATPTYFPPVTDVPPDTHLPVQMCLSGPDTEWHAIRQLYFELITSARSEVLIQSPFFILDETITEALKLAAMSGVAVRVMISARGPGQYIPYWAANTFAAEVARAGVEVLMFDGGYLHAKTVCIDSKVCAIGSANWDIRSFSINYEQTAVIYDATLAKELRKAFQDDLQYCSNFTYASYRKRPRLIRFRDSVARLGSPLL